MLLGCIVNEHCREDSALLTQFHFLAWKSDSRSTFFRKYIDLRNIGVGLSIHVHKHSPDTGQISSKSKRVSIYHHPKPSCRSLCIEINKRYTEINIGPKAR